MSAQTVTMIEAINRALGDAMEQNDKVLVLGEDVADPEGGGIVGTTRGLSARFGDERVRSTPISEQAIIGAAIGASLIGWRPVAEIMLMNFTAVAMDMIVNHAAKLRFMSGGQTNVPITIRTMTGAGISSGGQHSDHLEAWFAHTAGLKVVTPATPGDAYGLLLSCIDDPDPCIFVESILTFHTKGPLPPKGTKIPLGKASVTREGADVTVLGISRMSLEALGAADIAQQQGVSCEVIDLRTVSPWDQATVLSSVAKTGRLLIVHEAVKPFGAGAEIAAVVGHALHGRLKAPIERLAGAFAPVPFSKPLETEFVPDAARIAAMAIAMVKPS
ncbi:MAG TPA: alpha-ketoacid dehydrogenase subunit beta [Steroidobacteraceae bacterium]|jgi:pyruvate dehydrogenase E1 component beta subunit